MYPTEPAVEVLFSDHTLTLFTEAQLNQFRGFTEFECRRYLKKLLEGKKRAADVVTLDDQYLKWCEYHASDTKEGQHG